MKKNTRYLNVTQAAEFIGVSRQTIYGWIETVVNFPEPVVKIGNRDTVLYDKDDIKKIKQRWLAKKKACNTGWKF